MRQTASSFLFDTTDAGRLLLKIVMRYNSFQDAISSRLKSNDLCQFFGSLQKMQQIDAKTDTVG